MFDTERSSDAAVIALSDTVASFETPSDIVTAIQRTDASVGVCARSGRRRQYVFGTGEHLRCFGWDEDGRLQADETVTPSDAERAIRLADVCLAVERQWFDTSSNPSTE